MNVGERILCAIFCSAWFVVIYSLCMMLWIAVNHRTGTPDWTIVPCIGGALLIGGVVNWFMKRSGGRWC